MRAMTCHPALIAAGLMLACVPVSTASRAAVSSAGEEVSYEAFMRLDQDARRTTFAQLSAETKSALKREHARRWLARNEGQLTGRQQALLHEAIAFLSPELYRSPPAAALRRQEDDLRQRLQCGLGQAQLIEALTFLGPQPAPQPAPTWDERVNEWLVWFSDCVLK
jgi:hypothetical protein